jgi:hypothetical protein
MGQKGTDNQIALNSCVLPMTSKTSTKTFSQQKRSDPPMLWIAAILGSVFLHGFIFWMARLTMIRSQIVSESRSATVNLIEIIPAQKSPQPTPANINKTQILASASTKTLPSKSIIVAKIVTQKLNELTGFHSVKTSKIQNKMTKKPVLKRNNLRRNVDDQKLSNTKSFVAVVPSKTKSIQQQVSRRSFVRVLLKTSKSAIKSTFVTQSKAQSIIASKPASKSQPKPQSIIASKPASKSQPKPQSIIASKPASKTQPKPQSIIASKPANKTQTKLQSIIASKVASKTQTKLQSIIASKVASKTQTKLQSIIASKVASKTQTKPQSRTFPKIVIRYQHNSKSRIPQKTVIKKQQASDLVIAKRLVVKQQSLAKKTIPQKPVSQTQAQPQSIVATNPVIEPQPQPQSIVTEEPITIVAPLTSQPNIFREPNSEPIEKSNISPEPNSEPIEKLNISPESNSEPIEKLNISPEPNSEPIEKLNISPEPNSEPIEKPAPKLIIAPQPVPFPRPISPLPNPIRQPIPIPFPRPIASEAPIRQPVPIPFPRPISPLPNPIRQPIPIPFPRPIASEAPIRQPIPSPRPISPLPNPRLPVRTAKPRESSGVVATLDLSSIRGGNRDIPDQLARPKQNQKQIDVLQIGSSVVTLDVFLQIDDQGRLAAIGNVKASSNQGSSGGKSINFEALARQLFRDWEFQPARSGGKPVYSELWLRVTIKPLFGRI